MNNKQIFSILLSLTLVTALAFPFNVLALTSKTYSFTQQASQNYITVGTSFTTKATSSWYNPSYSHRLALTINKEHIGEELTDFPVVVQLTSEQSHLFNTAREDGYDLVFTDKNNTKLSHEIESFDKNNKEATIWVKVPTLKPTEDTVLYLYYGNPISDNNQNVSDVWSNGYVSTWHLDDDPADQLLSSTSEADHIRPLNGGVNKEEFLSSGKIGNALKANGVSKLFSASKGKYLFSGDFTLSLWMRSTAATNFPYLVSNETASGGVRDGFGLGFTGSTGRPFFLSETSCCNSTEGVTAVNNDEWHHIVGVRDGDNLRLYIDSAHEGTRSGGVNIDFSNPSLQVQKLTLGSDAGNNFAYTGKLDEVRVANVMRSSAWISAEYANQSGDEDFLIISTPTATGTTSTSLITLKKDKALGYSSLTNFTPNGSTNITYQLSPNAGKTWYYYTKNGWTKTSANTPIKSSSANDISKHLSTLPEGTNKLLWRAMLQPNSTLDSIKIGYTPGNNTETTNISDKVTTLYNLVFGIDPTTEQKIYWETRLKDKPTLPALLGAMQWQKLFGK